VCKWAIDARLTNVPDGKKIKSVKRGGREQEGTIDVQLKEIQAKGAASSVMWASAQKNRGHDCGQKTGGGGARDF